VIVDDENAQILLKRVRSRRLVDSLPGQGRAKFY
jgi:hypothetical protein